MARPLAGPGQRAPPARARRAVTMRGRGQSRHGGEPTVDSTLAKVSNKPRGNGHWTSAYMPLQENLGGEAGKGSSLERSSARRWRSALRRTSGSKRKKSPEHGSPATQERHEHEEHGGGAHRGLVVKGMTLTGGGRSAGARCVGESKGRGLR
jgi:hypothetical protein